ncbi:MAG TPA: DUF1684 domain-containing protein [Polyangia bacterium]|nr:DUF1684 domain-containing protein [Polyangia bacterium]
MQRRGRLPGLPAAVVALALGGGGLLVAAMSEAAPPASSAPAAAAADDAYTKEIEQYRRDRERRLRSERGWLTLVGLFWLADGPNRFGSDPRAEIVLPAGSAPAQAGTVTLRDGGVSLRVADGVAATINGKAVTTAELRPDDPGPPDVVMIGSVSMQVIKRSGRLGIRLKDSNSPARRQFAGLRWFPVNASYRVTARFVPHEHPVSITVPSAVGPAQTLSSPGAAVFTIEGHQLRLDAVMEEPSSTELFFIFRDKTTGSETYGAGRFLYTPLPRDGQVVLDFNKAFSPPCAFTVYATCPLPPPQNRLPIRIPAGELALPSHAGVP